MELRQRYHKGISQDGTKSVALTPESYNLLKSKAEELDVTIKSLLAVLIENHINSLDPDQTKKIGG